MERITDYDGGAYFARIRAGPGAVFLFDRATNEITLGTDPRLTVRLVGADTTATADDDVVIVDAAGPATVALPPVVERIGAVITVCRRSATGTVTVRCAGADAIWGPGTSGAPDVRLQSRGAVVQLVGATDATWQVVGATGNVATLLPAE